MRISDWSSDVCSSDLPAPRRKIGHLDLEPHAHFEQPQNIVDLADFLGGHLKGAILRAVGDIGTRPAPRHQKRSEEHTSELQSLMRISYAVFCLKKKKKKNNKHDRKSSPNT